MQVIDNQVKVNDFAVIPDNLDSGSLPDSGPEFCFKNKEFHNFDFDTHHEKIEDLKATKKTKNLIEEVPKRLLSRQTEYRAWIDIFAEHTPALITAAMRNWKFFQETIFKSIINTSVFFTAGSVGKNIRAKEFSEEFKNYLFKDPEIARDMLLSFRFEELENLESFKAALKSRMRKNIDNELIQAETKESQEKHKHISRIERIKDFFTNELNIDEELIAKAKKYKEKTFINQSSYMGFLTASVPFLTLMFRRYILGVDRFTGSMHYVSAEKDKAQGNNKIFTKKQMLGTLAAILSSPLLSRASLAYLKANPKSSENPKFLEEMREQHNPNLGLYPKQGAIFLYTGIPHLVSKLSNAQGILELTEDILKTAVTMGSMMLGDRLSNGRIAKVEDDKLSKEFNIEKGILYYPDKHSSKSSNFLTKLADKFPEQSDYRFIKEKANGNKALESEALKRTGKVFARGFAEHAIITFLAKLGINGFIRQISKVLLK
ncbi:MAG: hypothetical protein HRT47_05405 [Candidatus Caenarcaniphilales bacterium]|nr:hypothetical protein [Candidatus Caenarcaniphilales bacterium]